MSDQSPLVVRPARAGMNPVAQLIHAGFTVGPARAGMCPRRQRDGSNCKWLPRGRGDV